MESDRSKWRLHWLTWLVVLAIGGLFVYCQFFVQRIIYSKIEFETRNLYGWPYVVGGYVDRVHSGRAVHVGVAGLLADVGLFILVILSVAFATERCRRFVADRFRMRLGTLFSVTAVVAVLLAAIIHRYDLEMRFESGFLDLEMNGAVLWRNRWLWGFVVFAGVCMLYTLFWLIARGCATMVQALSGSSHSVSSDPS